MAINKDITSKNSDNAPGVDDAVGVSGAKWFVAIVNNRSEKLNSERLTKAGIENYAPTQTIYKVWNNGKKAKVERVVIPTIIFVRCTDRERKEIVTFPYIFRFMTNRTGTANAAGGKPLAVVSDDEINRLKFMLGQSDVPVDISDRSYRPGDRVRIIRGSLAGIEGEIYQRGASKSEVYVALEHFGCARVQIDTVNLEIVK